MGPEGKRTTAAVCMEEKRVTTKMRNRATYMWPPIRNKTGPGHNGPVEQQGHQQKEGC